VSLTVILRPEAAKELRDAYRWYQDKSQGLGEEFLRCVDAAFNNLIRHPESGPLVHHNIRRVLTRRFPYAILYLIENHDIVVLAVFHGHRQSEEWKERG
jgi:plasmid stabilization system protein ParE